MKIGDAVYYVNRPWRRIVSGEFIVADEQKIVFLVKSQYTWIRPARDAYPTYEEAERVLSDFISTHGPIPIEGEKYDG